MSIEALQQATQAVATIMAEQVARVAALTAQVDSLGDANITLQAQIDLQNEKNAALEAKVAELQAELAQYKPAPPKDVRDYKEPGDLWNAAIRKAMAAGDGRIPAMEIEIDPLDTVVVGPGMSLEMDPNAVLRLKPNAAPRYCGIRVEGGTLKGGQIIGDRLQHTYTADSTHEWGYGFQVRGDGSYVSDLIVKWCTGDGFGVSGTRHKFDRVVSVENRRQGGSGFTGDDWEFNDCVFADTGALDGQAGTAPRAGFDCEPDKDACNNVRFNRCRFSGNDGGGLVMWARSATGVSVTNVQVNECTFSGSANAIHGKSLSGLPITVAVKGSNIKRGSGVGIKVDAGMTLTACEGNTFSTPTDRTDFTLTGMDSRTRYDTQVLTGGRANVGTNRYV